MSFTEEITRQFADCNVKAIATIELFMPVAQTVAKALKDYKGTIWVGGEDDKANGNLYLYTFLRTFFPHLEYLLKYD